MSPSTSDIHPLLTYVAQVLQTVIVKQGYRWKPDDWPEGMDIRVRSNCPPDFDIVSQGVSRRVKSIGSDFILGSDKAVFFWPFKGIEDTDQLRAFFKVKPFDPASDYNPSADALGDPLLAAGDDIATGPAIGLVHPGDPFAAPKLVTWAIHKLNRPDFNGYALPENVKVVPESMASEDTWVECGAGGVILHLGVKAAEQKPVLTLDDVTSDDGTKAGDKIYAEWPCGAFGT